MKNDIIKDIGCDIETGVCEVKQPFNNSKEESPKKPVKLLFFTDPICSSCWGIEPQLRKLKQEYGDYFDMEYRMGGLLKNWSEYGGSDVNGPESVAEHWEEARAYYQMPIDGDVWKEDPLHSSYPPGVAFKAAQFQGTHKAERFLRRIKEMVFLEKTNITRLKALEQAAKDAGLDAIRFKHDFRNSAKQLFEEDLAMTRQWGVRGFPTIYFIDGEENRFKVYGSKPYHVYEQALLKLLPKEIQRNRYSSYETIFNTYDTVTLKEYALFYDIDLEEAESILNGLLAREKVERKISKAGSLWKFLNR